MRYLSLILILTGCLSDHLILRSKCDYLPLKEDNSWTYLHGSDTLLVAVVGDTTIEGLSCYIVVFGADYQFWHKDEDGVRCLSQFSIGPSGVEYTLESRYYPLFPAPFVDHRTFADSFSYRGLIEGDTVRFFHRLSGEILLEEQDRYLITLDERIEVKSTWLDSTILRKISYLLAPDIGIESFTDAEGKVWDLLTYSVR
ncbi:hypothetical protein DRP53_04050 [candidate division WOR-3 bacterium]|uniref:DUF3108 domain-containing protein n=1 Tax=candidate division WOR-3 bacterium TaxID=2052148 RepID=A0A660SIW9_UNCW3|nr:MAG: hypothetical protein DRP53_04050 [candidate division WOR-3 bacterium]